MSHPQCCDERQLAVIHRSLRNRSHVGGLISYKTPTERQMLTTHDCHPPVSLSALKTDSRSHTDSLAQHLINICNNDFITLLTLAQLVWDSHRTIFIFLSHFLCLRLVCLTHTFTHFLSSYTFYSN